MLRITRRRADHRASLPLSWLTTRLATLPDAQEWTYVSRLVELGIVSCDPGDCFSEGGVRPVRLMQTLERAGSSASSDATSAGSKR
jgi:hypothetical protein